MEKVPVRKRRESHTDFVTFSSFTLSSHHLFRRKRNCAMKSTSVRTVLAREVCLKRRQIY